MKHILAFLLFLLSTTFTNATTTLLVGFPAGGGFDILARKFAVYAERELNTNIVVTNILGAGGAIALTKLDNSDSKTLLLTGSVHHTLLMSSNTPIEKYKYPGIFGESYFYIAISKKHGLTCEAIRDTSAKFFIGTNGPGTATGAGAAMIINKNPNITDVPYKGAPMQLTDLLSNQIHLSFLSSLALNRPDLTIIANTSSKNLDNTPGWNECLGVDGTLRNQYMIVTTANAADDYVIKINQVINKFVKDPDTMQYFKDSGIIHREADVERVKKLVTAEHKYWNKK
jgi:tripartite-type tricarboxylate transporter receptor subunit TctC